MFFVNILETTLSCSAVIAVVLILSLTIGKFFQSKYKKGIWLLIALRLLIPVSFFCFLNPFVVEVETVEYIHQLMELAKQFYPDKYVNKIHGTVSQKERDEIKTYVKEHENSLLICSYETMSTGVNIPNIMAIHFPDGGRSKIRIKQSVGRGVRLHPKKEFLTVFDYQDQMKGSSFMNHWKERNNKTSDLINYIDTEFNIFKIDIFSMIIYIKLTNF